ncbi:DHA2 family efflux MFS transporter permease subunit [Mucilaginibacter conchicola]|uniref:DHA2 family efflux MFS transporter permease subunit n=1 Tax=Mucilaginibacter conchicola TaxID=2303333 RepID=A0A372NWH9_9SPHI|nr:MFS transporter [Mucilaginibacter conchicola]RFZ94468.1 DHA2 family efflux MFS transporter permease subunit [Mucilaginibacter conchicola]
MATVALNSKAGKWVMVSCIMASAMAFIDGTALNVVLPALQKSLNAGATDLFWLLNAYLLILASLILIGGSLGDKFGRKKVFMAGIFVFICGSAACGFAKDITWLIVFRVLQGLGGAFMIPGSLSLISSSINAKERGKAIGTWSAFTTVVTMGGPILGGAFADAGLWRYIFFINVPIGVAALTILWKQVAESRETDENPSIDIWGAVAIALGLATLTFGFLQMPALGLQHWQVYGSIATGVLLLIIFIIIEKKSNHPMMPLQLFKNLTFSGANLLTLFLYAGLGAGMLFMGLNMVQVQGYSQLQSGLTFLPFTLLMIGIARFAGALADKHGPRLFLIGGPALAGVGLLVLSFIKQTAGPSDYWTTFFPGIILFGLGMSFTVSPLTAAVMGSVSEHFSGVASGVNNAITRVANVFANAILGALAVVFFFGALQNQLKDIQLSNNTKQEVMQQSSNLGNAKPPNNIPGNEKQTIEKAYKQSFISAYGNVMRISALLAFTGALMGVLFIRNSAVKQQTNKAPSE